MIRENKDMPLWEHLEELRWTIFKILGTLAVTTGIALYFSQTLYTVVMRPIHLLQKTHPDLKIQMIYTSPFEPVIITMKIALMGGVVLAFPVIFMFMWDFVSPGLSKKEHYAFLWGCLFGTVAFTFGIVFGYLAIDKVLGILAGFKMGDSSNLWRVSNIISFVIYWLLGAGFIFELPLIIVILSKIGVVNTLFLRKIRPYFFIGSMVLAAIVTPPDPFTMLMVGVPLAVLYEFGIFLAGIGEKKRITES